MKVFKKAIFCYNKISCLTRFEILKLSNSHKLNNNLQNKMMHECKFSIIPQDIYKIEGILKNEKLVI